MKNDKKQYQVDVLKWNGNALLLQMQNHLNSILESEFLNEFLFHLKIAQHVVSE